MKKEISAGIAIIWDGKVLLAHTAGRNWKSGYGIPKGHVESGETYIDAAIRETYEEVGIKVDKNLIDTTENTFFVNTRKRKNPKTVYWFTAKIDSLDQIGMKDHRVPKKQLQLEEVDWAGFMTYNKARKVTMLSQLPVLDTLRTRGLFEKKTQLIHLKLFESFKNGNKRIF
tara:strand:+ start:9200 stop:9712 length:513 start_codon:yes stop_codon:yes gene_type:complete